MVFETPRFKVRNLSKIEIAILASFSLKYDVTDAILLDNEKMNVRLLFDCLKLYRLLELDKGNIASYQTLLLWQPKSK